MLAYVVLLAVLIMLLALSVLLSLAMKILRVVNEIKQELKPPASGEPAKLAVSFGKPTPK